MNYKRQNIFLGLLIVFCLTAVFLIAYDYHKNKTLPGVPLVKYVRQKVSDENIKKQDQLTLAITPHHLIAKPLMDELFEKIVDPSVERVVLISPNHFKQGKGFIQTTDSGIKTDAGVLLIDKDFVGALLEKNIASVENPSLAGEHGINNLAPLIKKSFPNAQAVPLMIDEHLEAAKTETLAKFIDSEIKDKKSAVILSADFSHYLTDPAARFHDSFARRVISGKDFFAAGKVDIDCPSGLEIILRLASSNQLQYVPVNNSNSAILAEDSYAKEPTSYVTGYFSAVSGKTPNYRTDESDINLLFFGDLMLDRDVRRAIEKKGMENMFANSERLFLGSDANIANLEGSVADFQSVSVGTTQEMKGHFSFVFSPDTLPYWKEKSFDIFHLGNNHIMNFGVEGLDQTKRNLQNNRIGFWGDPLETDNHYIYEANGVKVGLFSYNQFRMNDHAAMVERLKNIRPKVDLLVVYTHWGEEYKRTPNNTQKNLGHAFIDAGADAVIGSHPHVTQSIERYKDKYIFYSLGNFIFDQFFSRETMEGLAVGVSYDKNAGRLRYYLIPIRMNKSFQMEVLWSGDMKRSLEELADLSFLDEKEKAQVRSGIID